MLDRKIRQVNLDATFANGIIQVGGRSLLSMITEHAAWYIIKRGRQDLMTMFLNRFPLSKDYFIYAGYFYDVPMYDFLLTAAMNSEINRSYGPDHDEFAYFIDGVVQSGKEEIIMHYVKMFVAHNDLNNMGKITASMIRFNQYDIFAKMLACPNFDYMNAAVLNAIVVVHEYNIVTYDQLLPYYLAMFKVMNHRSIYGWINDCFKDKPHLSAMFYNSIRKYDIDVPDDATTIQI